MRQINLLIKRCEECPYYQHDPRVAGRLCKFRENSPFAIMRTGTLIDDRCELPEYYDLSEMLEDVDEDNTHEEEIMCFNTFSSGLMEVRELPGAWTFELTPEERERFNREMQTVDEKKKEEVPFDEFDQLPDWK